jgi:hypothetical protein
MVDVTVSADDDPDRSGDLGIPSTSLSPGWKGCRITRQLSPISRSIRDRATSRARSGSGASISFAKAR